MSKTYSYRTGSINEPKIRTRRRVQSRVQLNQLVRHLVVMNDYDEVPCR